MGQPLITITGLSKTYRLGTVEVPALRDVTLTVDKGEFVAIAGPSGCGKSTLLYLISGLATPTRGSVMIDGKEIAGLSDRELSRFRGEMTGFVFQRFNLLPSLSIADNISLAERIRAGRQPNRERIRETLALVGLSGKEKRKPSTLSIGEQQRAAIARAIIHRPPLLLADEPTGNLDSANAAVVVETLATMHRELGQTILLVTHDESVARAAQRVVRMKDGCNTV